MKTATIRILALAGLCALATSGVSAQTVIGKTPDGDLRVVDYKGKPPYKRRIISVQDAEFARFEEINNSVVVTTGSDRRNGPAGKALPAQFARVQRVNEAELSQFARFEETESTGSKRMWRGAPGKGRPNLNR